jgi:hypothetical protein
MGFTPKAEPSYFGIDTTENVHTARITFIVRTTPEDNNGIEVTNFLTFNIRGSFVKGSQSGKYQVMDDYGRDAWVDEAVMKAKGQILYKNGPANINLDYHPVLRGEIALTNFLRVYLGIPNPANYINGNWVEKTGDELADAKLKLESFKKYFSGDVSEIKEAIALQPENKVTVAFGIRTDEQGREYQSLYSDTVIKYGAQNYNAVIRDINERKANGGLSSTVFDFTPLHEYTTAPTNLDSPVDVADPFGTPTPTTAPMEAPLGPDGSPNGLPW